jgi:CheY-like chemotaxis protein
MKVLVVEDNALNRSLITLMLQRLGVQVIPAESGPAALTRMQKEIVDFMFLDINLGAGMSGIQLMQRFRAMECYRDLPILAVTAYRYNEIRDYCRNGGFTDYLGKPFRIQQLKTMLEKYAVVTPAS